MFDAKIEQMRAALYTAINPLLPAGQTYVDLWLGRGCAGIKYLYEDGKITCYEGMFGHTEYYHISELPLEALNALLKALQPE